MRRVDFVSRKKTCLLSSDIQESEGRNEMNACVGRGKKRTEEERNYILPNPLSHTSKKKKDA